MDATEPPADVVQPKRNRAWASLLVLAGAILAYLAIVSSRAGRAPGTESPAVGMRLSYFQLEPLTGNSGPVSLDDLQGRITIVSYWGTWCPPCRRELPQLAELAKKFGAEDHVRLYAVSCGASPGDEDAPHLRAETELFLSSKKLALATYSDENAASRRALVLALGASGLDFSYPTTLVLDRRGVIRGFWQGYDGAAVGEMAELVKKLLVEPAEGASRVGRGRSATAEPRIADRRQSPRCR